MSFESSGALVNTKEEPLGPERRLTPHTSCGGEAGVDDPTLKFIFVTRAYRFESKAVKITFCGKRAIEVASSAPLSSFGAGFLGSDYLLVVG